ncbi:MAG: hypothetical protein ACI9MC_003667 [Kiritimatiellia bacterium]|jgi:hypothetical protein
MLSAMCTGIDCASLIGMGAGTNQEAKLWALVAAAWWPALLAGLVAIAITLAIERYGGLVGGLLGTLPTTIVPFGLGLWIQDPDPVVYADAMGAVPLGMLIDALFLLAWRVVPRHLPAWSLRPRLALMSVLSLVTWFGLATLGVWMLGALREAGVPTMCVGGVCIVVLVAVGLASTWRSPPAPKGDRNVGPVALLLRGTLAASAIAAAIGIAQLVGPHAAGLASVFPAIFITTMVSLWLAQGEAVPAGAVGPMMLGSASVAAYAMLVAVFTPTLGVLMGCGVAWCCAVICTTLPALAWLRVRVPTAD